MIRTTRNDVGAVGSLIDSGEAEEATAPFNHAQDQDSAIGIGIDPLHHHDVSPMRLVLMIFVFVVCY